MNMMDTGMIVEKASTLDPGQQQQSQNSYLMTLHVIFVERLPRFLWLVFPGLE